MTVERFNPLGEEAFDGRRCGHGTLIYARHDYPVFIGSPVHRALTLARAFARNQAKAQVNLVLFRPVSQPRIISRMISAERCAIS